MPYDFYAEYCKIHNAVYGRDPCTREQWAEWCKVDRVQSSIAPISDIEFDNRKELEGDAQ